MDANDYLATISLLSNPHWINQLAEDEIKILVKAKEVVNKAWLGKRTRDVGQVESPTKRSKFGDNPFFSQLPIEIIFNIFSYLSFRDIIKFGEVNQWAKETSQKDELWLEIIKKEFSELIIPEKCKVQPRVSYKYLQQMKNNQFKCPWCECDLMEPLEEKLASSYEGNATISCENCKIQFFEATSCNSCLEEIILLKDPKIHRCERKEFVVCKKCCFNCSLCTERCCTKCSTEHCGQRRCLSCLCDTQGRFKCPLCDTVLELYEVIDE